MLSYFSPFPYPTSHPLEKVPSEDKYTYHFRWKSASNVKLYEVFQRNKKEASYEAERSASVGHCKRWGFHARKGNGKPERPVKT